QSVVRAEHRTDAAPAAPLRHAGILRMAPHLHLVFLGHGDDTLEEIGDALPVRVGVDLAGDRQRRILLCALVHELAVARWTAALRRTAARNADEREVVFHLHDPGARADRKRG